MLGNAASGLGPGWGVVVEVGQWRYTSSAKQDKRCPKLDSWPDFGCIVGTERHRNGFCTHQVVLRDLGAYVDPDAATDLGSEQAVVEAQRGV
eukprot:2181777-Rhodomonas_salina.1